MIYTYTTVEITYGSETVVLETDLSEASAPLVLDGESTQYQTADTRHRTDIAVLLAAQIAWPEAEWPCVPRYGDSEIVSTEAWDDLLYETVDVPSYATVREYVEKNVIGNGERYLARLESVLDEEMHFVRTEDGGCVYEAGPLLIWDGQCDTMVSSDNGESWAHV